MWPGGPETRLDTVTHSQAITTTTGPVRVTLELERGAEPVEGRLWVSAGQSYSFTGWIELMGALGTA